ncbi:MAG: hypothetical protein ACRCTM_04225 [Sphaerotilus sulfidivorans]|uniref:hypothetical protein n=1 Tax=Sphaerotilus sulfidivorans TaxID=639200 RepID=UPI003F2CEFF9
MGHQDHLRGSLDSYAQGFSVDVRATFERFDLAAAVERLQKARLLYLVTADADLNRSADRIRAMIERMSG